MEDLFDTPEALPLEVQAILEKYSNKDFNYKNCGNLVDELEQVGYTCEYGLDASPYDLRKVITNGDLNFELDKIKWNQESIENDIHKMAVSKEEDFNLDFPYLIDVEDTSYSYATEEERNSDYETLCIILSNNSYRYLYN
jgi:hypothetical protein